MRKHLSVVLLMLLIASLLLSASAAPSFKSKTENDPEKAASDSEEYPLVSYPAEMFDPSVLYSIIITDKNYDDISSSKIYGKLVANMSWGNIYLVRYHRKGFMYSSLLAEGNYSCCYDHYPFVYAVNNGKDIWRYDITTGEGFLIASSENDIDLIFGYDDLVFCSSGSSVYLCRVSEGTLKEIYNNPEMLTFYPLTNHVIQVSVPNPFYTECLAHEFTDAASYYDWFISNNGFSPFEKTACSSSHTFCCYFQNIF